MRLAQSRTGLWRIHTTGSHGRVLWRIHMAALKVLVNETFRYSLISLLTVSQPKNVTHNNKFKDIRLSQEVCFSTRVVWNKCDIFKDTMPQSESCLISPSGIVTCVFFILYIHVDFFLQPLRSSQELWNYTPNIYSYMWRKKSFPSRFVVLLPYSRSHCLAFPTEDVYSTVPRKRDMDCYGFIIPTRQRWPLSKGPGSSKGTVFFSDTKQ